MYTPVTKENLASNRWHVYSKKIRREVRLQGDLEYDHWVLIETDPLVQTFCEKPREIIHFFDGKPIKSVFDMWIKRRDGAEEFVAVHYSYEMDTHHKRRNASAVEKVKSQEQWCQEHRYLYSMKRENEIRSNPILLENKKLLLPYIRESAFSNMDETVVKAIKYKINNGCTNVRQIENELHSFQKEKVRRLIFTLMVEGLLNSNIDQIPIGHHTEVFLNGNETSS
ncbi:hypothetical protein B5M42_002185 [Paenibacillus athensensis]|uniref:TnsA endonuclease N-terminal domain-containing protein n=1 Tax=Paenibacillus athensensis TaxID=1967502 RepID=A0A4Y8QB12_9BACL|nr:hypothetical protein [Paenibacillus athensensis]MCD1257647.1 hypothetical protein [Paenibacillus athensensis]